MKNFAILKSNIIITFILTVSLVLLSSCQKEENIVIDKPNNDEKISASSQLTALMFRVSQNPTSIDNVLDRSSCVSVNLPVGVFINGVLVSVGGTNGISYQEVQNIINSYPIAPTIVMDFPISVKHQDHSVQQISSQIQMNQVLSNCSDDDGLDEIDCININYPITIASYNTNTQVATTITIQNNQQLFAFLTNGLGSGILANINYPISISSSDNQNNVITSNSELENFIENSIDDCDDTPVNSTEFTTLLTSGTWRISYFYDDVDDTSSYSGFNFAFQTNGNVIATKNAISTNGTWSRYLDSSSYKFVLGFDGEALNEIEEDWKIIEFTGTILKLKHISGGNGGTDYLTFTKN